jgi:hypothetical protein
MGRATLAAVAALLTFGTAPASAAATVEVVQEGARTLLTDAPGQELHLELVVQGNHRSGFVFRAGPNAMAAGSGCRSFGAFEVVCDTERGNPVELRLGDGADIVRGHRYRWSLRAHGGPGADRIYSGTGSDRLDGADGDDEIDSRDLAFGAQNIGYLKRPVRDSVRCGGGIDVVLADALDRVALDCERPHRYGTTGPDRLIGDSRAEVFRGRGGDDLIAGGPGQDEIEGERGDDRIDARDGERDVIDCGDGRDLLRADRVDLVIRARRGSALGCERVRRYGAE